MGVLQLFSMRGQNDVPYRAMIIAFEHHKKTDLTGYPKHVRPRVMSIYSKIVAVADAFDAATSRRAYQSTPLSPADVLQEMRINPHRGMDQVLVKAFMSLVGHYPVGTLVVLDTFENGDRARGKLGARRHCASHRSSHQRRARKPALSRHSRGSQSAERNRRLCPNHH